MEEKHKCGTGEFTCPECGSQCEIECVRGAAPFADTAYCDECEIKYSRNRDPVAEQEDHYEDRVHVIDTRREEQPEYDTYYCKQCEVEHENTVPAEEFSPPEMEVQGYDMTDLICKCGNRHDITGWSVDSSVECDCGREFSLSVSGV